jgi:hypothetical protein
MTPVTALHASSVPKEELKVILAAYLELDRARVFRRLFVFRFGVLAVLATVVALTVPGLSLAARWLPPLLCLAPPAWAWVAEFRLARRLARHLRVANIAEDHGDVRKS